MRILLSSKILWSSDVDEIMSLVEELGYQGLELWFEHLFRYEDEERGRFNELMEKLGEFDLPLYIHGPIMDLNITSSNSRVADLSLNENLKAVEVANDLEARNIVIHPGRLSSSKDTPEDYWGRQIDAFLQLTQASDCPVVVENMSQDEYGFVVYPQDLKRLLSEVSASNLGICLDIPHAYTAGAVEDFLKNLKEDILHIHYSNAGLNSVHAPLDKGKFIIKDKLIQFLKGYQGGLTIEGRDPQREMVLARNNVGNFYQQLSTPGGGRSI